MILKQIFSVEHGVYCGRVTVTCAMGKYIKIRYVAQDGSLRLRYTGFRNKEQLRQLLGMIPDDIKL